MRYEVRTGYEKCKRILQLLQNRRDNRGRISLRILEMMIFKEIGTDRRTVERYVEVMLKMGLMKRLNRWYFVITRLGMGNNGF